MKEAILKLIEEYQRKINDEDVLLESVKENNRQARSNQDTESQDFYRKERMVIDARRQAYIQTKADLDSLLDHL